MKEGLLLKVIPSHLVTDMKKVLSKTLVDVDIGDESPHIFIERYDKVRYFLTTSKTFFVIVFHIPFLG